MPDDVRGSRQAYLQGVSQQSYRFIIVCSCAVEFGLQVVAAGSPQQVADAMRDAEQYKEPLMERGVLVVPLPIYEGDAAAPEPDTEASTSASRAEQAKEDLR